MSKVIKCDDCSCLMSKEDVLKGKVVIRERQPWLGDRKPYYHQEYLCRKCYRERQKPIIVESVTEPNLNERGIIEITYPNGKVLSFNGTRRHFDDPSLRRDDFNLHIARMGSFMAVPVIMERFIPEKLNGKHK